MSVGEPCLRLILRHEVRPVGMGAWRLVVEGLVARRGLLLSESVHVFMPGDLMML